MRPIRIAIFSLSSGHAVQYIMSLPSHPAYEWVAVSVSPEYRGKANLDWVPSGVKIYETEEELLNAHPNIDAVIMAGANYQTFSQVQLCAQRGIKNLLSMKIPTFNMEEYTEMQRLVHENGIVFQVELEMRFDQTVRHMKQLCDSNAIGKLVSMQIYNTTVCVPPELGPWMTIPEQSYGRKIPIREGESVFRGGALSDHPHAFDLARYFSGSEFESVYAEAAPNIRRDRIVEDGVFVIGRMKNGVITSIDPSYSRHENVLTPIRGTGPGWEGYPKRVEVNVVLNGEHGSILGDCFHSGVYHTGLPRKTFAVQYVGGSAHFQPTLDSFACAIRDRTSPLINIDTHRKTIEVMNACYDSIWSGQAVELD